MQDEDQQQEQQLDENRQPLQGLTKKQAATSNRQGTKTTIAKSMCVCECMCIAGSETHTHTQQQEQGKLPRSPTIQLVALMCLLMMVFQLKTLEKTTTRENSMKNQQHHLVIWVQVSAVFVFVLFSSSSNVCVYK